MKIAIGLLLAAVTLGAADPVFERAWNKLDLIDSGRAKPGSVITFTEEEINAWVRVRVPQLVEGVRNPHVMLGAGTGEGTGFVDFVKMRQGEGVQTNPILAKLIEGERPLKISVRLESANGSCTVYLTRVELSGVVASGYVLDFLTKTFFLPLFPDAKINQPFELRDNIERIEVRPGIVRVAIKK